MLDAKADPNSFRKDADCVAVMLAAQRVFGPLRHSFAIPAGWVALAVGSGGASTAYPSGRSVEAAGVDTLLLVRNEPIQIEISEERVSSADGYPCNGTVRVFVGVTAEAGALNSFRRAVLAAGDRADRETLAKYLRWQSHRVMAEFAEKRPAADLVAGKDRDAVCALMAERLNPALFAAGMVLRQPPLVSFECEALPGPCREREVDARRRDEQAARRQLEDALAAARCKHLPQIEELLQQLRATAAQSPTAELADVIRTFTEPQRRQIYDALWTLLPAEERTQWIVVAAGDELLCFDPNLPDAPARRRRIEGPAGPLRSVRLHRPEGVRPVLLVGAARGLYQVTVHDLKVRAVHTFEPPGGHELRGGVNSAAAWKSCIFGTHSEVGLVCWDRAAGGRAEFLLADLTRRKRAVRGVQVVGRRLVFSADEVVIACPVTQVAASGIQRFAGSIARITAVYAVGNDIFAGNEIGDLWHWRCDKPAEGRCIRRGDGSPIEGFQRVSSGGVPHIIFAERGTPALQSMALGDTLLFRYETAGGGVRRCALANDVFVAIDDLRDRLICWRPGGSKEPCATIPVSAQCGYPIQDVCLVTETLFG
jgi:hypothetical protein